MRDLGIRRTELGALGWLPTDPVERGSLLEEFDLSVLGGFVPLVLHEPALRQRAIADAVAAAETLSSAGATYFVTATVSSHEAWQWQALFDHLAEVGQLVSDYGLRQVVHPHVNTMIETSSEFQRFLDNSAEQFCLDTGHLFIGGADPVAIAATHHERVGLVHIKDVDRNIADRLVAGELTLMEATQHGLFPAAGSGDVPIAATVRALQTAGYDGWYVLEQDVALTDGEPALGEGPVHGVRRSIDYLATLAG
jgi:inosose dehydratase